MRLYSSTGTVCRRNSHSALCQPAARCDDGGPAFAPTPAVIKHTRSLESPVTRIVEGYTVLKSFAGDPLEGEIGDLHGCDETFDESCLRRLWRRNARTTRESTTTDQD